MWCSTRNGLAIVRLAESCYKFSKHRFMSAAFKCEEAWNNRLNSDLLKKVNLNDFFYEIDTKFTHSKSISAVDVDIFVNAVNNDTFIDEMEDIILKLRLTSSASEIFPSTHHAFIRNYIQYGQPNELMRILNDRLNYGIFPDDYCSIFLLDYFIEKQDFRNAAKVGVLHMLQEDFSNDLIKYMSLYSSFKYLVSPTEWEELKEEEVEEEEEEIKIRVKYLRNPFFDNHFDLREPNDLIGKTLVMISDNVDESIVPYVKLVGHCLLKEWDKAIIIINNFNNNEKPMDKTTFDIVDKIIVDKASKEGEKSALFNDLENAFTLFKSKNLSSNNDLFGYLEKYIKQQADNGDAITQEQIKLYSEWEDNRVSSLHEEIEKLKKVAKLKSINEKKQELIEKEQEVFFFDREDELDLKIENKRVPYPKKWIGKKKKKSSDNIEYVPPEITKQKSTF